MNRKSKMFIFSFFLSFLLRAEAFLTDSSLSFALKRTKFFRMYVNGSQLATKILK